MMALHSEAQLDRRFVEMVRLLNTYLNHFPKHEKYGLALEIRRAAYAVYALIVEAQKRHHKKTTLTNMDIAHEQLRKHALYTFRRAVKNNRLDSIVSSLGHARKTASFRAMRRYQQEQQP